MGVVKNNKIYVLHKRGAVSHYMALEFLLKSHGLTLEFREFAVLTKIFKSIKSLDFGLLFKQVINIGFMFNLFFSSKKKIVIGIEPFDKRIIFIRNLVRRHNVYYHTSWACWDGTFHPKHSKNSKIYENWKSFLTSDCKHIFTVTNESRKEISKNFKISNDKISVVYHSVKFPNVPLNITKKPLSFIYFGRLVKQKGVIELVNFFKNNPAASFTLIGNGPLEKEIVKLTSGCSNINYLPHISKKNKLLKIVAEHQYFVMNSKKTNSWEELFGIALIESMQMGLIAIATDHVGPSEILDDKCGYLISEGDICHCLKKIINKNNFSQSMSKKSMLRASDFELQKISKNWIEILT